MRIISLSPSLTEILTALDLERDLIGVTEDCPKFLSPKFCLGSPKALDLEKFDDLKPDLILADTGQNRPDQISRLKEKYRVISYGFSSIPSLIKATGDLGELLEKVEPAKKLIREIYEVWEPAPADPVRTLILLWNSPFLTVNANTYASSIIEAAGGLNVFRDDPVPEIPIEIEDMIDQTPDLILLPGAPFPFSGNHLNYFQNLPPFSQKTVRLIDGAWIARCGPQTISALKGLKSMIQEMKHAR